jgi:hypothetical protein
MGVEQISLGVAGTAAAAPGQQDPRKQTNLVDKED